MQEMVKNNIKFTRAVCWINSKISKRDNSTTITIFLCYQYCCSLLWCNYRRSWMLSNLISWSRLKLPIQVLLALHPRNSLFNNNCNITANSIEKHCFMELNVKVQVKLDPKPFIDFENYFRFEHHHQHGLFCLEFLRIIATRA